MKVLWLTFTVFPEALELYTGNKEHKGSGGWLFGSANELLNIGDDLQLGVAMVSNRFSSFKTFRGERIQYYMIPSGKGIGFYHHGYDKYWEIIKDEFKPDVVHIHGLESSIGLTYIRACGKKNVVCSVQGIPNIIARYLMHGLTQTEMLRNASFRDILRFDTYYGRVKADAKKSAMVEDMLYECDYFIGRTDWDRAHVWAINPKANYFFCNETLRSGFYNKRWEYEKSTPHTIFLSATKGLHLFLCALPLIIREYPDTQVRVATGGNLAKNDVKSRLLMTDYEHVLRNRIKKSGVCNHIRFLGPQSEEQMINQYLDANVFVCPSTCENSSNAVCEAQLLGVPLVASYVGGMADLIPNESCGKLYRDEEYEMLAKYVCELFERSSSFDNTEMRNIALARHDRTANAQKTIEIYKQIRNNE